MRQVILFLVLFPAMVLGELEVLRDDSKRAVDKISQDLNITEDQFVECFSNVNPAPEGERPSARREQMNKSVLLPCLQQYNSDITNEKLDSVMDKYRPEGPAQR